MYQYRKYKKYFILASVLLLALACNSRPVAVTPGLVPPPTPAPEPTANWNTYTSPIKYGFSIKYPKYPEGFGVTTDIRSQITDTYYFPVCGQNMLACLYLIPDSFKATNFDGAGVSINIDPALNTDAKCYDFAVPTSEAQTRVANVTINGVAFKSATGSGGAAGHFDKLQIYRNFHNSFCYEIGQEVVETNIANYPAGKVSQFDENAVWGKLQGVVNTFKFTN